MSFSLEVRDANRLAWTNQRDSSVLKALDASIKKNSAAIKKLKTISAENAGTKNIKKKKKILF
jgi:hypothetical protein